MPLNDRKTDRTGWTVHAVQATLIGRKGIFLRRRFSVRPEEPDQAPRGECAVYRDFGKALQPFSPMLPLMQPPCVAPIAYANALLPT